MYEMNEKNIPWIRLEEVASTNEYAKGLRTEGRGCIITAKRQTGGRGTKGRSFSSDEGGVYLSKLSFYEGVPAKNAFQIMINGAVAVCKTLQAYGLQPVIKWPNDIFVRGKKICGILIENALSGKELASSIVGIGLNVRNELPLELAEIATTMAKELDEPPTVDEVTECLIAALSTKWTIEEYRAFLGYMGERVTLLEGVERVPATLLFVTDEGRLVVEADGRKREVSAAEVSIRI